MEEDRRPARREKLPKGFCGCPHRRTLFGSRQNSFGFHIEPSVERVLHRSQKVCTWNRKDSTWNQKGFFKGFSDGDSRRTLFGSRNHFFLRAYTVQYRGVSLFTLPRFCSCNLDIWQLHSQYITCREFLDRTSHAALQCPWQGPIKMAELYTFLL